MNDIANEPNHEREINLEEERALAARQDQEEDPDLEQISVDKKAAMKKRLLGE